MKENNLLDPMQSAYRSGHSTETALLRVHNDIVSAIDKGHGVFLILLDLSAAFDMVDHEIRLSFLKIILVLKVQFSNSLRHIFQIGLSVSLLKVYCLNLVNSLTAYLRDLSLIQLHLASTRFLLAQFFDITKSSTISMLMILIYIVLLILILQMKFSPPFRPAFQTLGPG